MQTVFSHIVQKRFSQVNEDVATDALAFILHSNEAARTGMMKLLRGVAPDLPGLQFRTQQAQDQIRPDMAGYDNDELRVFVENKFWAGLTDNQPVAYLRELAEHTQPTVLLVIVPAEREQTLWRELNRRLEGGGIAVADQGTAAGIVRLVQTEIGPNLALTSWTRLLSVLELEVADDQNARSDLLQLRALCEAADSEAFIPISSTEATDQRIPALILQLSSIMQAAVDLAVSEGVLDINRLMPQASWERIGRYARFSGKQGTGMWVGVHFDLWRRHGVTPLWLVFASSEFGRAQEVRSLVEPWAAKEGVFTTSQSDEFLVAIDIEVGEGRDRVIRVIVDRLKMIAGALSTLEPRAVGHT
ncbi:MAG: hypothetical protein JXA14_12060 [Anaerolineae bacterium]|nr:hypothetical protein [Anaerolineae bacterium]